MKTKMIKLKEVNQILLEKIKKIETVLFLKKRELDKSISKSETNEK